MGEYWDNTIGRGLHLVVFTNSQSAVLDIKRVIFKVDGCPMFLVTQDGVMYNYANVLSTQKVEESMKVAADWPREGTSNAS